MEAESQIATVTGWRDRWARLAYALLVSVVEPLVKHWRAALIAFLIVLVLSLALALRIPYAYEATASLLVSSPAYERVGPSSEFMPPPLDIPTYARLLAQPDVLEEVGEQLVAEKPDLWGTRTMSPNALARRVSIETEVIEKTPQRVNYSRVLTLRAKTGDPEQSKHLVDVWVQICAKRVRELSNPGTQATIDFIRSEYDAARDEVERREDELKAFQLAHNIELKLSLLEQLHNRVTEYTGELRQLEIELAEKEERLRVAVEQLSEEDQKLILRRSPSNDALVIGGALRQGASDSSAPVFEDEILNSVWMSLRDEEKTLLITMSGLQARKAAVEQDLAAVEAKVEPLRGEILDLQLQQSRLKTRIETGMAYFRQLAAQREDMAALEANLKMEESGSVVVANSAVLPERPTNTLLRWAIMPIGLLLGAVAAVAAANLAHELARVQEFNSRQDEAKKPPKKTKA